jgi:periplasmic protein TonB
MIDPVSSELEQRAHLDLPWRWAVAGALAIHMTVAAALLLTPTHARRSLTLPHVQVRITAAPPMTVAAPARRGAPPAAATPVPAQPKAPAKKAAEPPPRHVIPDKKPAKQAPPASQPAAPPPEAAAASPGGAAEGRVSSAGGGIALGVGAGGGAEDFPFAYYLNRVLALIESNWFRPPTAGATSCRVRCVIDRAGRLVEAGLESESAAPAFDRAALRAVYAAAPFPPLPQGFGGQTLTLHLEFGP